MILDTQNSSEWRQFGCTDHAFGHTKSKHRYLTSGFRKLIHYKTDNQSYSEAVYTYNVQLN